MTGGLPRPLLMDICTDGTKAQVDKSAEVPGQTPTVSAVMTLLMGVYPCMGWGMMLVALKRDPEKTVNFL